MKVGVVYVYQGIYIKEMLVGPLLNIFGLVIMYVILLSAIPLSYQRFKLKNNIVYIAM